MERKEIKRKHREFINAIKSFEKRSKNISIVYSKSILDMCAIQINIKHYLRTPVAREMLNYIESICHYEDDHWYIPLFLLCGWWLLYTYVYSSYTPTCRTLIIFFCYNYITNIIIILSMSIHHYILYVMNKLLL